MLHKRTIVHLSRPTVLLRTLFPLLEVVGAMVSVLMIWVVTGVLVYLAIMRIVNNEYEINGKIMLITSGVGVVVNIM